MTEKEREYRHKEANVLRMKAILMEHPEVIEEATRMTVQAMTREQVEYFIKKNLVDIHDLLQYYSPDCVFLSIYIKDGNINVNGSVDAKKPLGFHMTIGNEAGKEGTQ